MVMESLMGEIADAKEKYPCAELEISINTECERDLLSTLDGAYSVQFMPHNKINRLFGIKCSVNPNQESVCLVSPVVKRHTIIEPNQTKETVYYTR